MTPAEYLRALDRAATPGPWEETGFYTPQETPIISSRGSFTHVCAVYKADDIKPIVALRTLLPLLADVVEAAEKRRKASIAWERARTPGEYEQSDWDRAETREVEEKALDRLTAAVAEVEGTREHQRD